MINKQRVENLLYCWGLSCLLYRIWDNYAFYITTLILGIVYYLSIVLLLYNSWRRTKNLKQALKDNRLEVCLVSIPFVLFAITRL